MNVFSERLKELRKGLNLTQRELADKIGTNNSSICDWECGRTEPSIDYIVKLCDFFEIDADYLIGRKDI